MSVEQMEKAKEEFHGKLRKVRDAIARKHFYTNFLPMAVFSSLGIKYLLNKGTIRLGRPALAYGAVTLGSYFFTEYRVRKAYRRQTDHIYQTVKREMKLRQQ